MADVQDPSWGHNSIPLAILTSSNQEKNACQDLKNISHSNPESVNLNSTTSSGCSSLMERDYIGLSDSSSPSSSIMVEGISASHNGSDCNDTELRLGFGPSPVVGNAKVSGNDEAGENPQSDITAAEISVERKLPTAQTMMKEKHIVQPQLKGVEIPRQDVPSTRQQHMQMFNGSSIDLRFAAPSTAVPFDTFNSAQKFWQAHLAAKAAEASEAGEAAGYWSTAAAGRFLVPVPKVSTVPAKRPYVDALGDCNRDRTAVYNPNLQAVSAGSGWHMGAKVTSSNGPFTNSVNLPSRSGVQFKVPAAVQNGETSNSSKATVSEVNGGMEDDNGRNKAPVVGWPPVRSFRRNTLAAAAQPKREGEEDRRKEVSADGGAGPSELTPPEQGGGVGAGGSLFVKAKLDGVRICRKVDLKSYDSYGSLKSALQDMFQGFVGGGGGCGENMRLDLLHGNTYVLTHQDKEGDCMLVGDVPWNLFVTTVKSLRIMKSSDAIGQLGERVSPRL